jgi:endonuclease YncB( thermonuclease family)
MTAIHTALSESPKSDVVRYALERANAELRARLRRMSIAAVIGMVAAFVCGINVARSGDSISGLALVIDGDTIVVGARTVRLWGIDAPEIRQTCTNAAGARYRCGIEAARQLEMLILGRDVTCATVDTDRYGRDVARCSAGGKDIGAAMVRAGWAVDYRRYSKGAYAAEEAEAKTAMHGVWAGGFERPEAWRHDPRNKRPFEDR